MPLVDYLSPMDVFEGHDEFLGLIPRTILIQHYVSLRIVLKQLVVQFFRLIFVYSTVVYSLCIVIYSCYVLFSSLTTEVQRDLPNNADQERCWLELVPSFAAEIYEAQLENAQADYGFPHGYDSDTESIKVETCSSVTQFDLLHEDDLDDFHSLRPIESMTGDLL